MTPKRTRFVAEYLVDLNASAAARRAGYKGDPNTVGPRLLANVGTATAVREAMEARSKRLEADADWVLRRLAAEADADLADLYDEHGKLRPVKDWPLVWRQGLVAGVETVREKTGEDEDGNPEFGFVDKVKLSDRVKRLELIGKHVGVQAWRERELLKFKLPPIKCAADCVPAQAAVLTAAAAGELTAAQAAALSGLIEGLRKSHQTVLLQDMAKRFEALEAAQAGKRT